MTRERKSGGAEPAGHLDARTLLDYLDGVLATAGQRTAEQHLAGACANCRERLRAAGALRSVMRADRTPPVPAALRERALSVFGPAIDATPSPSFVRQLASLLFDSLRSPAPVAVRRAVGDARRLRFAFLEHVLEVEFEPREAGIVSVRGRLHAPDAALHRVVVRVGEETAEAWPDATGAFSLPRIPPGSLVIQVEGPAGSFETPPVEP